MTHKMILMSHDFKEVHKIVVARRKDDASVAQQEERGIRIPDNAVRGCTDAPQDSELSVE
jgi:hypothetical protein